MPKTHTTRSDVAEHLRTPKEMAAYLEACLEELRGNAAFVAKVPGDIARAQGMAQVARDAGLSRESLYKALSGDRTPASTRSSKWFTRSGSNCTPPPCGIDEERGGKGTGRNRR